MADPVYALIFIGLALALLVATLIPAPRYPTEDEAGLGLGLLATGCVAALAMGILALLALPVESAVLGAIAWLLVMPCIWLARAPRPLDEWGEEDEEDDDGGSPAPDMPSAPPAPDDRPPGLQHPAAPPARVTWAPAPQAAPVMATAARVKLLLAQQEAERSLAAQEVKRILATVAPAPSPPPPAAPQPLGDTPEIAPAPPAPVPGAPLHSPAPPAPVPGAPLHKPPQQRLRRAPRARADHRTIADVLAAVAHARTRRRGAPDAAERHAASHR